MEWLTDYTSIKFISFVIISSLMLIMLLFLITSSCLDKHFWKKYRKTIVSKGKITRVFVVDAKNDTVTYFYKSDIATKYDIGLDDFYSLFHVNDIDRVKNWIVNIQLNAENVDSYLEADSYFEKSKTSYFSLLKLLSFNPNNGLIHIESNVLKHITPLNSKKNKSNVSNQGQVTYDSIKDIIENDKAGRGFTFSIQFFPVKQVVLTSVKIEKNMIKVLKNSLYPFASNAKNHRFILDESDYDIVLFDLKISKFDEAARLADSLAHSLRKCIGVNGYDGVVKFSIGVVQNFQFYKEPFKDLLKAAEDVCMAAQSNDEEVRIYKKTSGQVFINQVEEKIGKLLKNPSLIRIRYRPVVDVQMGKILGYQCRVVPQDSPFSSYYDMMRTAAKVEKNEELFSSTMYRIFEKFYNERPVIPEREKLKLFTHVSLVDFENVLKILPQIANFNKIHVVLIFDEQEINDNVGSFETIISYLSSFKARNFEIAMLMKDKNLKLPLEFYSFFDYFVVDAHMVDGIKKNERIRLSIHALVEQLLRFKKPIIATDIKDKQSIELIVGSGINLVSAEDICAENEMLMPVEKKKMDRLVTLYMS